MVNIFHLSFPVNNLQESLEFYQKYFNAKAGRKTKSWIDIIFFGHQITLHERPEQVFSQEQTGVRHFGIILGWSQWLTLGEKLLSKEIDFLLEPTIKYESTPKEQGKFLVLDPNGNKVEIKSYRNFKAVFG